MIIETIAIAVTLTSYRPVKEQTDDSPEWTSIGEHVTKYGAAASQDLLASGILQYGDTVYVPGFGYRTINDCMAKRHKNAIDLLVFTKEEEHFVGVRHLKIYRLERLNELQKPFKFKRSAKPQAKKGITK